MNNLFDEILKSYAEHEYNLSPDEDVQKHEDRDIINLSTFCNMLRESQVNLSREQIGTMLSVLTPKQTKLISDQFKKDPQFWY